MNTQLSQNESCKLLREITEIDQINPEFRDYLLHYCGYSQSDRTEDKPLHS